MSNKHNKEYYLTLWTEVREKLLLAAKLDPPQKNKLDLYRHSARIIFGASSHNYRCNPMKESEIQSYEKKLCISFPMNFRTYLTICGNDSAGPDHGIKIPSYVINNINKNIKKDCPFKPRRGMGFDTNYDDFELSTTEYTFKSEDISKGTIEISTSGNPCTQHLVVYGATTRGDVFSYTGDMLFYEGSFEVWYQKWLDKILEDLQSGKAKKEFDQSFVPRANKPTIWYSINKLLQWLKIN